MRLLPGPAQRRDAITADVSDARVARLWSGVSERLNAPRRWPWFVGAGAAVSAALLIFVLVSRQSSTLGSAVPIALHATVAAEQEERRVLLGDGSALALAPRTQVFVAKQEAKALELDLKGGEVTCEVAHVVGRQFVVRAGAVKVIAVGTRFSVSTRGGAAGDVAVAVQQGIVEVHAGGSVERLTAGQRWSSSGPAAGRPAALAKETESSPRIAETPASPSAAGSAGEGGEVADAKKLFETANHARRAGEMRAAAAAYEALLRRYPADGRATLAAFELGRLRMDHLGDAAGAISALNRAASSGGGSVREDAMARLVRAYAATGARDRCLRARERYERSYPEGHHGAEVRAACGPH